MIVKTQSLNDVLEKYPDTIDVFKNHGFQGLDNKHILKQLGSLTLETVLKNKGKNVDVFVSLLNESLEDTTIDVTLQKQNMDGNIDVVGLLPCPVRIPLLEAFSKLEGSEEINVNLKAASEGLDWLKESVQEASSIDDLADVYISAGFDLFFEEELMKKYKDNKDFSDYFSDTEFNKDFNNSEISLQDPNQDYSMIGVVPAVFLVNTQVLGDRPIPRTWKDLFDPMYKGSISLPVSDFDLFNAIMLHLHREFGEESIVTLREQLIASMHPSQMVKSDRRSRVKPAISIMPYFFTKMALPGSVMQAVWPEDGAIVSPIFMLTKSAKREELYPIAKLFQSKEIGEILSHKGLFPSINQEVDNKLKNNTFKWVGWDYINNNDIGSILTRCMTLFEKGVA